MSSAELNSGPRNHSFPNKAVNFETVQKAEIELIKRSGGGERGQESLAALCLSGGGIRSAIFSLGCLQALDQKALLQEFDYLSTVSGGGYIGSWLSALISNLTPAPVAGVPPAAPKSVLNGKIATDALQFLRDNSSYLTPRNGIFSGDTWCLLAIYIRNLTLNWLLILPLFAGALLVPRMLVLVAKPAYAGLLFWAAIGFGVLALIYPTIIPALPEVLQPPEQPTKTERPKFGSIQFWQSVRKFWMEPKQFVWARLLPLALMILSLSIWYYAAFDSQSPSGNGGAVQNLILYAFAVPAVGFFVVGFCYSVFDHGTSRLPVDSWVAMLVFLIQTFAAVSTIALTLTLTPGHAEFFFVWFPFTGTMIFLGTHILFAGLSDPIVADENREWWARSAGYFVMTALGWSLFAFVALVLPGLIFEAQGSLYAWLTDAKTVGVAGALSGALAFITKNEDKAASLQKGWAAMGETARKCVFGISLCLFLVILTGVISFWTERLTGWVGSKFSLSEIAATAATALALFGFSYFFSIPVNINRFSAHAAYRNRLVRTFLGASNSPRFYNVFTGFSSEDNVFLDAVIRPPLRRGRKHVLHRKKTATIQRPFHVICAAANLATGERLAWQDRKAVSFTFSGLHCGSFQLGYRPSDQYGGSSGTTLGTAMTISAAAVNSGMGFYSSPLKSFLLTALNARLGWWLGNPSHANSWQRDSPTIAFLPMLDELFSLTDAKAKFINLSDGGHFDNTGVYEMLRRRCGRVLLIDADTTLGGMTNLTLRARVDLNTHLARTAPSTPSQPFEEYSVHYPSLNGQPAFEGLLIRIFPQVESAGPWCSFESVEYQRNHPDFPGTSLLDQFFTEQIFEAYRKLGFDIMNARINQKNGAGLSQVF